MNEQDIRIEARNWCGPVETDRGCTENQAENLALHFFNEGKKEIIQKVDEVFKDHMLMFEPTWEQIKND